MSACKLNKNDIKILYRRCLQLIRNTPPDFINLRRLRGAHGYCNWTDIDLNPRGELLATAYHECIHYLCPEWSETMVLYAESRIINNVSLFDNAKFLKQITDKIYKFALQEKLSKQRRARAKKNNASRNTRRTNKRK
jgi:hypothetical protein